MKFVINNVVYPTKKQAAKVLYKMVDCKKYPHVTFGEVLYELGGLIDCDSVMRWDIDVDAIASRLDEIQE